MTKISYLSVVDSKAVIGQNVSIGPFCVVGPNVTIGDNTILDSHVSVTGRTTIGKENRFWPNTVIGGEPQDKSYSDSETEVIIGDRNTFREGVTVNRGADKEDGITRIDNDNLLMANAHVAHNCHVFNKTILVNGVLLGGHVHVHDGAIISGNSVVHHFSTIGTLAFVSGGCRVPHDIPPFMLAAGSDDPKIKTINIVGLRRAGISEPTIRGIKKAFKSIYRQNKPLKAVREQMLTESDGVVPMELNLLFEFLEQQKLGRMGRGREVVRKTEDDSQKEAA